MRWVFFVLLASFFAVGCGASAADSPGGPRPTYYDTTGGEYEVQATSDSATESRGSMLSGGTDAAPKKPAASSDPRVDYDRKFVKTAWLDLEVSDEDDFEPTIAKIQEVAEGLGGYAVEVSSTSITTKVPTERLDEALVSIASIAEVTHRNVRVSDVTAQYVDMQIRIANLEKVRIRLQELVEQGEDVKAILEVEKELNRVTRELESLKGQMRMLSNQVTFATIHVDVEESVTPGPIGWIFYGGYKAIKWLFVWD